MERFADISAEGMKTLEENASNKNTKKSTKLWLNVYRSWAGVRGKNPNPEEIFPDELNTVLKRFFSEVRKKDGEEYEPDCLRVMLGALHRHLVEKKYPANVMRDVEFRESRNVLEGKARQLRAVGMGKRPNASKSLSKEEEEVLWKEQRLGAHNPTSLIRTLWFYLTQHLGLRGCQEHSSMTVEDFEEKVADNGSHYIVFTENPTKTRPGGLKSKRRQTNAKMFATGGERCPVRLFNYYLKKRPVELRNTGRFYLVPMKNTCYLFSEIWYMTQPMGKNTINTFMKDMIAGTDVENGRKKLTNHSARKTLVRKLKSAGIPESSIIKVTGHTTTAGLTNYDPEDENEFQSMSNAVQNKQREQQQQQQQQQHQQQPQNNLQGSPNSMLNSSEVIDFNVQFSNQINRSKERGMIFNPFNSFSSAISPPPQQPIYNFYNCQVTLGADIPRKAMNMPKRRRLIIDDSSEDEE